MPIPTAHDASGAPGRAVDPTRAPGPAAGRMRVACLLIPDLPLQAALRTEPEQIGRPLVVTTGPGPRAEILSASREAARGGVHTPRAL